MHDALAQLLHPLCGGPTGGGWTPGRDVFLSDVAAVVEHVDGVDYVDRLAISLDGRIGGEHVAGRADRHRRRRRRSGSS